MTTEEALDLALEALEYTTTMSKFLLNNEANIGPILKAEKAITAINQARSAPVQKRPQNCGTGYCSCVECVMEPAPVQEPVWFSIDEVKPIEGQMVLAWYKGFAYPDTAVWLGKKGWAMDAELASPYWDEVQNPITHWMPLPQGPKALEANPAQSWRAA